jgi:hypothetical protein
MFCARCGAEHSLRQRYCRQCGILLAEVDSGLDQRVSQELAKLREGDCRLGNLALNAKTVSNSLIASLVFLLLLTVRMVNRGEVHIDLILLIGSLLVCGWQFRRFRRLFREFIRERYSSSPFIQAQDNSAELPVLELSIDRSRRQTAPLSVTEQTTLGLKDANRFLIPTVPLNEPSREAHGY